MFGCEHGKDYPWKKVYRFLTSRVGRPWDRVFSEFCPLKMGSLQYRTQEQIAHSVTFNTFIKDGKVWYFEKYSPNHERQIEDSCSGYYCHSEIFYIHPKTKLLCYYKPKKVNYRKIQAEEEAKTLRILGDYHQLIKLDGIWYEVKGEPVQSDIMVVDGLHYRIAKSIPLPEKIDMKFFGRKVVPDKFPYKIVDGKILVPVDWRWHNGKNVGPRDRLIDSGKQITHWNRLNYNSVKITVCRQLNHKELKKHGLKNDVKIIGKPCRVCGNLYCTLTHR